jgi:hypothetical protein
MSVAQGSWDSYYAASVFEDWVNDVAASAAQAGKA